MAHACTATLAAAGTGNAFVGNTGRLREALVRFYEERQPDKLQNVDRIAKRYNGDGVVGLWLQLGQKYSLEGHEIIGWLSETLDHRVAVQWPETDVPPEARRALDEAAQACAAGTDASGEAVLQAALSREDGTAAAAVAFRHGCFSAATRAHAWRFLLFGPGLSTASTADSSSPPEAAERAARQQRLEAYRELLAREEALPLSCAVEALRAEIQATAEGLAVQADADSCTFLGQPQVLSAIVSIVFCHARRLPRLIRGSCEVAALFLFVLACGSVTDLAEAEADTFWCLSQLWGELGNFDGSSHDVECDPDACKSWQLLRIFDPTLAEHFARHGLQVIATARLAECRGARMGFALQSFARLWDVALSDPHRFDFVDCAVSALLILARDELLQRSDAELTEAWLGLASRANLAELLPAAYALCALQRRGNWNYSAPNSLSGGSSASPTAGDGETKPFWSFEQIAQTMATANTIAARSAAAYEVALGLAKAATFSLASKPSNASDMDGEWADVSPASPTLPPPRSVALQPGTVDGAPGTVLTQALAEWLIEYLPIRLRMPGAVDWNLRYSPRLHGVSISTLFRNLASTGASVLVVRDSAGHVFGGFAPETWEPRGKFYGSGEAFVFTFGCVAAATQAEIGPSVYPWTSKNSFIMYADSRVVAMGGDNGHHALAVQSDLLHGQSSSTATFGNAPLASSEEFVVRELEIWTLDEVS